MTQWSLAHSLALLHALPSALVPRAVAPVPALALDGDPACADIPAVAGDPALEALPAVIGADDIAPAEGGELGMFPASSVGVAAIRGGTASDPALVLEDGSVA